MNLPNQSGAAKAMMNRLGSATIAVNQGLELIQRVGNGINRFMDYNDEAMMINSRIGMMNDGLIKHYELQKKILQMANDTRSGYAETVDMMSKLTMSALLIVQKGLWILQSKLIKLFVSVVVLRK